MKKKFKKIFIGTLFAIITFCIALVALILNPQILFAHKVTYREFNIYSKDPIPENYKASIDYAIELIHTSEIYEPGHQSKILLCNETWYNNLDARLFGPAMARCISDNILLKVPADFDKNALLGGNSNVI